LTQISAEEYAAMRQTLLQSKHAFQFNQPQPDSNIQAKLRKIVGLNKQTSPAAGFLHYSIPAWQVVAAACVLFLLFVNFKSAFITKPEKEIVFVHKTDTVYKDIPVRLVDSTAGTFPDSNTQIISKNQKRVNQSPRQSYHKSNALKRIDDTLFVSLPELNTSFTTTYDTAILNSVINKYLHSPADKRRGGNDKAAFDLIERVY
jgi:hypothetical protein